MIEAPLCFLEVEIAGVFRQALECCGSDLGHAPETFNAVDMDRAAGELILRVVHPEVAVAEIDDAVVATQATGMRSLRPR